MPNSKHILELLCFISYVLKYWDRRCNLWLSLCAVLSRNNECQIRTRIGLL